MLSEIDDLDVVVVSSGTAAEGLTLRRYATSLNRQFLTDDDEAPGPVGELATCDLTLISLKYGIGEAFMDADAEDGDLAAVMEEVLALDRDQLLAQIFPSLNVVLFVDALTVPVELRGNGYGARLIRGLARHFDFVPGAALLVVYPVPDEAEHLDRFTLRAQRKWLEGQCALAGLSMFGSTGAWYLALPAPAAGSSK